MVLSDVEETVTSTDFDEETFHEIINVSFPALYIQMLHTTVFRPLEYFLVPSLFAPGEYAVSIYFF
jgi:hypothetical protein